MGAKRRYTGRLRGVRRAYFRLAGELSTLVDASPTDFPDSLWKGRSANFA
jgi:hypothetical protein